MKTFLGMITVLSLTVACQPKAEGMKVNLVSPALPDLKSEIKLEPVTDGVKLTAEISGLSPGSSHGFHIHEFGKCEGPDFQSAGGHFNPTNHQHNSPTAEEKHLGDLGNLLVDDAGVGRTEIILRTKIEMLNDKSIILHQDMDDFTSQPAGNAGARIACGVIKQN